MVGIATIVVFLRQLWLMLRQLWLIATIVNIATIVITSVPFTPVGECRSADFAEVNDYYIRFSAVQTLRFFCKSRKPKVPLWENVDLLILLKSMTNIKDFLLFKSRSFLAKVGHRKNHSGRMYI